MPLIKESSYKPIIAPYEKNSNISVTRITKPLQNKTRLCYSWSVNKQEKTNARITETSYRRYLCFGR